MVKDSETLFRHWVFTCVYVKCGMTGKPTGAVNLCSTDAI
jgi:hypothetical protein